MVLKNRLYYTLFVAALVMVSLSLIIVCSMISPVSPGTVTISDGVVPLAALPADLMDRLENPENYEPALEVAAPVAGFDDAESEEYDPTLVDFRDFIPAE